MMTLNTHELEIEEIISSIKKTCRDSSRMDSSTVELIKDNLLKLQDYLTHLDNTQDLSSVVSDFIRSTNSLLELFNNHLEIKLTLKANITLLEKEFSNYQQASDFHKQLLFVPGVSFPHYDDEN
jgi:hypothetical protein